MHWARLVKNIEQFLIDLEYSEDTEFKNSTKLSNQANSIY